MNSAAAAQLWNPPNWKIISKALLY